MKEIHNLEEYISIIKDYYSMRGSVGVREIYFRGHENSNYKLIPSLCHILDGYTDKDENYIVFEQEIINRAKLEYPNIFEDNNSIDELALMQHYGLPTRLMDVTENPLVALYFSCISDNKNSGQVFIFNSGVNAETYTSYDEEKIKKENKIAFVRAKFFSNRQRAQQGLFMWFPNDKLTGIEKEPENNPVLSEILFIPVECKNILLEELKMVGISSKSLFPDNIDICCKDLIRDITKDAYSG